MRQLDVAGISYKALEYECDESDLSGTTVATKIGLPCEMVFKTLTAKGDKTGLCVFCIPADKELDLKKAAKVSGNKSVEMLHVKDLLGVTGYIRGGCTPIAMKKQFKTVIHSSSQNFEKILLSGGKIGIQLELSPQDLQKATDCDFEYLIKD